MHHDPPFQVMAGRLFFEMPVEVTFLSKCLPAGGNTSDHHQHAGNEIESEKVIETRKHSTRGVDSEQHLLHAIASPNSQTVKIVETMNVTHHLHAHPFFKGNTCSRWWDIRSTLHTAHDRS